MAADLNVHNGSITNDPTIRQIAQGRPPASITSSFPTTLIPVHAERHACGTREALTGYVRAATTPMFHPVGTAKMGAADDPLAVTGPDCAVRGVAGLWVADASLMPTIPQGNTNATAIMIGERASDLVLAAVR